MNSLAVQDKTPLWVWIDPSSACNLACALCYAKPSQSDSHLTPEILDAILTKLMGDDTVLIQKLNFNWRGDPLMNPAFIDLLAVIESHRPYFPWEFHTNGTLITPEIAAAITSTVYSGKVFVSIDGGNSATHDRNRGQGTFLKSVEGARQLLDARDGSPTPELGVFQLDLGLPDSDYDPDFVDVVTQVDEWTRVRPVRPGDAKRITIRRKQRDKDQSPALEPAERWWTIDAGEEEHVPTGACFWAGNAMFIAPNGDVSVCLVSHTRDGVLGNILADPLRSVLARASAFRSEIRDKTRSGLSHCRNCRMSEGESRQQLFSRQL